MAFQYTSNPNATQVPSPTPGPGVLPVLSLPVGTDAPTIESLYQAFKVDADFTGHIQGSVNLERPLIPVVGSGFTAVTYSSFGGTVTPSGNVDTFNGTRVVIQIQTGGAVGTATFKTSVDGGNTYGALQTTAASMTDATSSITLAFSGTFTANGTASFRSAYTPRLRVLDANLNGRWTIDHNGLPTGGRISQFREEWVIGPGATGSPWTTTGGAGAAIAAQNPTASYNARFVQLTPPTSGGAVYSATAPKLFIANASQNSIVMEFELGLNAAAAGTTSATTWYAGFGTQADPSTDVNIVAIGKKHNQANYQLYTGNGGLQGFTATSTAPTAGTYPTDRIRIEIQGTGSPAATYQAVFFVNESMVGTVTSASLPGATALQPLFGVNNEGGAPAGSPLAFMGPPTVTWNRFLNGPGL